jgi:hypothetical protein
MEGYLRRLNVQKASFWTVLGQGENIRGPFEDGRKL